MVVDMLTMSFLENLSPNGGGEPTGELADKINENSEALSI